MPLLMVAGQRILQGSKEIVLSNETASDLEPYLDALRDRFLPGVSLLINTRDSAPLSEFAKSQIAIGDLPTAYVCKEKTCELPTTKLETFIELVDKL
jgi:uncharacterized protein YyaL (SSP411 family)